MLSMKILIIVGCNGSDCLRDLVGALAAVWGSHLIRTEYWTGFLLVLRKPGEVGTVILYPGSHM